MTRVNGISTSKAAAYAPLLFLLFFSLSAHILFNIQMGDYEYFVHALDNMTLPQLLVYRYFTWTSRLLLEAPTFLIIHSKAAWCLVDIAFYTLSFWSLSRLFNRDATATRDWMIVLAMSCCQLTVMDVVASTVYGWTLACALFVFTGYQDVLRKRPITRAHAILLCLAALYAANEEMLAVVLLVSGAVLLVWTMLEHRLSHFLAAIVVIAGAEMLFELTCPGNAVRLAANIDYWMPEFASFSFTHKLYLGFADTMARFVYQGNIVFLLLCVTMAVVMFHRTESIVLRLVSLVPLVAEVVGSWLRATFAQSWPYLVTRFFTAPNLQTGESSHGSLVIEVAVVVALVICICAIYGRALDCLLNLLIAGGGLGSRLIMGFSPTLFASGERTFIYMEFAIIMLTLFVIDRNVQHLGQGTRRGLFMGLFVIASLCVLNTLAWVPTIS